MIDTAIPDHQFQLITSLLNNHLEIFLFHVNSIVS